MKKISSIKQLKAEKKRLKSQQILLEESIVENWADLKESVRPLNLAKQALQSVMNSSVDIATNGEFMLGNALKLGIGFLVKKLAEKGSEKLGGLFKKKKE